RPGGGPLPGGGAVPGRGGPPPGGGGSACCSDCSAWSTPMLRFCARRLASGPRSGGGGGAPPGGGEGGVPPPCGGGGGPLPGPGRPAQEKIDGPPWGGACPSARAWTTDGTAPATSPRATSPATTVDL